MGAWDGDSDSGGAFVRGGCFMPFLEYVISYPIALCEAVLRWGNHFLQVV